MSWLISMGIRQCRRTMSALIIGMMALLPQLMQAAEIPEETDAVFARYVKLGEDLNRVMVRVKDKKSADAESAAMQALLLRVGESRREIGRIAQLPPDVAAEISRKYEKSMRTAWGRVYESIYRLQRMRCYESIPFFRSFSILCSLLET